MYEIFPFKPECLENPAELAKAFANQVTPDSNLELTMCEEMALVHLDRVAEAADLHGSYLVNARRGFVIPKLFTSESPLEVKDLKHLVFSGDLVTYSLVRMQICRMIGCHTLRSLCLTFEGVQHLPEFDDIDGDYLLHVPAFSVKTIRRFID